MDENSLREDISVAIPWPNRIAQTVVPLSPRNTRVFHSLAGERSGLVLPLDLSSNEPTLEETAIGIEDHEWPVVGFSFYNWPDSVLSISLQIRCGFSKFGLAPQTDELEHHVVTRN